MGKREGKVDKKDRVKSKKRKLAEKKVLVESLQADLIASENESMKYDKAVEAEAKSEKKKKKLSGNKRKKENGSLASVRTVDQLGLEREDSSKIPKSDKPVEAEAKSEKKKKKLSGNKRKKENGSLASVQTVDQLGLEREDGSKIPKSEKMPTEPKQSDTQTGAVNAARHQETYGKEIRTKKSKKAKKKKDHLSSKVDYKSNERSETVASDVYHISAVDEDCSKGMKKWIMEYHQSRPGLKILQDRIDEFMTTHEEQEEQARKEKEVRAAEGGWTVVTHHKGRKKTTDAESGITVGSVAQAAVVDKAAKKKSKEVGPDFYRFQRREAHRNEIMTLQSKFEQDKKRIQLLRAARKFRPY